MLIAILILGLVLRLISLDQSLWWDEAINVVYARDLGLWYYLTTYILGDFHPPGWFFILWVFTHIFGFSEIASRLPSVMLGVATIFLAYLIGKRFSNKVGLVSALFLAVAPLHIYYSQEARPYALGAFAVMLSSYYFLELVSKNNLKNLVLFSISTALLFYSDYPSYFIVIAQLLYLIVNQRSKVLTFLKGLIGGVVLFLPAAVILFKQLNVGFQTAQTISGWKEVVGGVDIKNVLLLWVKMLIGRVSFENELVYLFIVGIISIFYLYILSKIKLEEVKKNYLFYFMLIPPVLGLFISFLIPIFSYFRFLYILPFFYIVLSLALEKFKGIYEKTFIFLVLASLISLSLFYLLNPKFHREDWRGAVSFLDMQDGVIIFENSELPVPYLYYSKKDTAKTSLRMVPAASINDVDVNLENVNKIYLVEYLVQVMDPKRLVGKKLEESGFSKVDTYNFNGVGLIYEYRKI